MTKILTLVIFLSLSCSLRADAKVDVFSSQLIIPDGFVLAPYSRPLRGTNFYRGKDEKLELIIISVEDDIFIHENRTSEPVTEVGCGLTIKEWFQSGKENTQYTRFESIDHILPVKLYVLSPFGFSLSEELIQTICAYE